MEAAGQLSGRGAGTELWGWMDVGVDRGLGVSGSRAQEGLPSAGKWPESGRKGQWSWVSR